MAKGEFAGLDPAVVSGNQRVAGSVSGTVDVNTTLRGYRDGVTVDSFDAAGRVDLGMSTIAGLAIDTVAIAGSYANRAGKIEQLSVTGTDVTVTGQGAIDLTETGASNLTLHAETTSLTRIGEIVGQPLKGVL